MNIKNIEYVAYEIATGHYLTRSLTYRELKHVNVVDFATEVYENFSEIDLRNEIDKLKSSICNNLY